MAYSDDIIATSPDHLWTFDAIYTDEIGSVTGTNTGGIVTESGICTDATNCWSSNTIVDDRITLDTSADIESASVTIKAVGGWFETSKSQPHPCRLYGEGDAQPTYQIVMAMGNNVMFEVVSAVDNVGQVYGITMVDNRSYHLMTTFINSELEFYIDGISQGTANLSTNSINARTVVGQFADPAGTVGIGGNTILLQAPVNGRYNYWATWEGSFPTATQIREELFAKGALAEIEIASQANLDSYADTFRDNTPLSFNVTGSSLDLNADNITFDERCSLHIRWEGTGTLNWTNTNGSNAVSAIATNGGTVNIINPYTLTINNIQNPSEVRIYDAGTLTEVAGQEDVINGTFIATINVTNVDIRIHSVTYKPIFFQNIAINSDVSLTVEQFFDRNYKND